ncbi:DNA/RNA non-specific endonuclease [Sporolactobacillus sp. KGMB 08714]|uniref:DNA/RNA non-specific endonuclease n=1 Tax=Sporolactobacillus sp. KGMB 08714 TaxID=3064704 RepID=UPI002FBD635E
MKKFIAVIAIVFVLAGLGLEKFDLGGTTTAGNASSSAKKVAGTVTSGIHQTVSGIASALPGHRSSPAAPSNLESVTYRSGSSAVITVNGNQSTLNPADWKGNKVIYSSLDPLNRTSQPNTGYLEERNLAKDTLRVRQIVKPTGWHQKFSDGEAILNRGHLIAYSLSKGIAYTGAYEPSLQSGDQNNPKNLFTQTAFSNQEIQTIYESKVRDALKRGKKVIYQAQAIFSGNDFMAKGVQLQAISTDRSLNFNVFIFNVQPGFQFNYADGTSWVNRSMTVPTPIGAPHFSN